MPAGHLWHRDDFFCPTHDLCCLGRIEETACDQESIAFETREVRHWHGAGGGKSTRGVRVSWRWAEGMFVMRSTSAGRFMLTTMASVAELEAGLISAQRDALLEQGGREEEAHPSARARAARPSV